MHIKPKEFLTFVQIWVNNLVVYSSARKSVKLANRISKIVVRRALDLLEAVLTETVLL